MASLIPPGLECKKHPNYNAVYKPTQDCEYCRMLYAKYHNKRGND